MYFATVFLSTKCRSIASSLAMRRRLQSGFLPSHPLDQRDELRSQRRAAHTPGLPSRETGEATPVPRDDRLGFGDIVGRYSFDVRLSHPHLSAGLSRRTSHDRLGKAMNAARFLGAGPILEDVTLRRWHPPAIAAPLLIRLAKLAPLLVVIAAGCSKGANGACHSDSECFNLNEPPYGLLCRRRTRVPVPHHHRVRERPRLRGWRLK
jgi:hypothetical protein